NLPPAELAKVVASDRPDLLCLSATMPWHVQDLKVTISEIRKVPGLSSLPILAGGRPFVVSPKLWHSVGADGTAATAQGALDLAAKLVERVA
ncbi:MAG: cobalamin-binding protein, partial [Spirochaetota bacterium]